MTYQDTHPTGRHTRAPQPSDGRPAALVPPPRGLPRRGPGGRRALAVLFWLGLVAAVLPWWLDTPAGSLTGTTDLLTAAGRITGLAAGYLLLVQVFMVSRLGALHASASPGCPGDLGATLLVAVLAHLALLVVGYAGPERKSILGELGTLLRDPPTPPHPSRDLAVAVGDLRRMPDLCGQKVQDRGGRGGDGGGAGDGGWGMGG
ncbi:hypothetical protein ABZ570_10015 [Micromonospora sp. NPDC007271]|uniref:hypothetical protein n=1 Tax=Micromonospora sp. NPDC007271 TaxID=3154587 RepID=UPI00340122D4